ncbi:hypothetical protein [Xanthomonas translucens]|uniref:hypothetical protein n=1 Tax=Xanthomonas campestris pv. translucens TaxID=343 RepID=UPI001F28949D|nr:hypothetical protein [Xanthomonas translucens]UII60804.1 hypothetical protein LZE81_01920 [Xanthomonas translucens]
MGDLTPAKRRVLASSIAERVLAQGALLLMKADVGEQAVGKGFIEQGTVGVGSLTSSF